MALFGFMSLSLFLTVLLAVILVWLFVLYTALIRKKNTVKEACSSIDVQLKKRYDLIPNILTVANKFMEHERDIFTRITELRAQALKLPSDVRYAPQKIELDNQIRALIGQIQVNAENYPQLKSDQTMVKAMQTFNSTEEYIAAARRYYNASVKDLNNAVEIFPSSVIASMLGIAKAEFIKADDFERQHIDGKQFFNK